MFCRFCLQLCKRKSGNETQTQGKNNNDVKTGFTNRAVTIAMEPTDGQDGPQREDERYEKLRAEYGMYEEILESDLDPQISGKQISKATAETSDGYLHPQRPSEEYEYIQARSVQNQQAEYQSPIRSVYQNLEPLEYDYVQNSNV